MDPKLIIALSSNAPPSGAGQAAPACPTPTLAEVQYRGPNRNRTGKQCSNCFMWVTIGSCLVHDRKVQIGAQAWCVRHVEGEPHKEWEPHRLTPLDPRFSGLREAKEGITCSGCTNYEPIDLDAGLCMVTVDVAADGLVGGPGHVQAAGACGRHRRLRVGMGP
jgi:hypothetical protein